MRAATTAASEAVHKQAAKSATGLLIAAVVQVFCALVVAVMGAHWLGIRGLPLGVVVGALLAGGASFAALALWARIEAFPAALMGLVLMTGLIVGEAVADPAGWQNGILIRTILGVAALRATQTGLGHWRLRRRCM